MSALQPILAHIQQARNTCPSRPLFVALQGPQGSGKSYISALVVKELRSASLNVASLSLDDIYLPHEGLAALSAAHPDNVLWRGRGQPGTHDIALGKKVLVALRDGNQVELPRFDKSQFNGEGDRVPLGLPDATFARPPVDVVLLEGWCVGFCPISDEELHSRWDGAWTKERRRLGLGAEVRKEHVQAANEVLKGYIELWDMFDVFIQLKPCASENEESPFSIVYKWRQEQEHNMKALNGGRGMDDIAVKRFVDRYIPGYVFFGDGPEIGFNGVVPRCCMTAASRSQTFSIQASQNAWSGSKYPLHRHAMLHGMWRITSHRRGIGRSSSSR